MDGSGDLLRGEKFDCRQEQWIIELIQPAIFPQTRMNMVYYSDGWTFDRFRHTGFSVYQGQPVLPADTTSREKLAVYISRSDIARPPLVR